MAAKGTPEIRDYRFGQIDIDGQIYSKDVIILPDRIVANWRRRKGHTLHAEDLEAILDLEEKPKTLVIGQGAQGRMRVARDAREALDEAGIEMIAESTEQAVVSYNALRDRSDVAAALHLTC